jgi:mycobactin lysine-N-oxygenase
MKSCDEPWSIRPQFPSLLWAFNISDASVDSMRLSLAASLEANDMANVVNCHRSITVDLAVIGVGPKGLALAAKALALDACGLPSPSVALVERTAVASSWTGAHGYTDGARFLGTPPDKDIGFPYLSACWDEANGQIDIYMQVFSWQQFCVRTGIWSEWIDRGRPAPTHAMWAQYLTHCHDLIATSASDRAPILVSGQVVSITNAAGLWSLQLDDGSAIISRGVVVTGTGDPLRVSETPMAPPRLTDGRSFWTYYHQIEREVVQDSGDGRTPCRVGVIGGGETAAAVAVALVERLGSRVEIELINPAGVTYSRGESFEENRVFSTPESRWVRWSDLTESNRQTFVGHTDRGVFSLDAKRVLSLSQHVTSLAGRVTDLACEDDRVNIVMVTPETRTTWFDFVVVARGFNPFSFLRLLDDDTILRLAVGFGVDRTRLRAPEVDADTSLRMQRSINFDLSLPILPGLHVPMLAALRQGPGFPNLSCLGLLSDRILETYTEAYKHQHGGVQA